MHDLGRDEVHVVREGVGEEQSAANQESHRDNGHPAETSDHQKPGACRIQNVVIRPRMPLTRNIQPMMMVKASVAIGGTTIAMRPRMTRMMPSARYRPQCSWIEPATARPNRSASF